MLFTGKESYTEILEKAPGYRIPARIGLYNYLVDLDGNVIEYPSGNAPRYRASSNKWQLYYPRGSADAGQLVECRPELLVGAAWYNVSESIWAGSAFADKIRECREFFGTPSADIRRLGIINAYGGEYWVTRFGDIWEDKRVVKLTPTLNVTGYWQVNIRGQITMIHRLVAKHFCKVPERLSEMGYTFDTLEVNHIDGDKANNRWDNLEWVTGDENMAHASRTKLMKTTISDELLEKVWQMLADNYTDIEISKATHIPSPTVCNIRQGVSPRYRTDKYTWPKRSPGGQTDFEQHQKIIDLWNQGLKYKEISEITGSCESHIGDVLGMYPEKIIRARRDNSAQTNGNVVDDATLTKIFEMLADRQTNAAIAQETGVRLEKIASIRARRVYKRKGEKYDWPEVSPGGRRFHRYTPEEREALDLRICSLRSEGMPYAAIAKMLKVDEKRISEAVKRHPEYAAKKSHVASN